MPKREEWIPKTKLGKLVRSGEVTSIEQAYQLGLPVLEPEIIDALIGDLKDDVLDIKHVQRTMASGRVASFMITVVIGDRRGHVGIGIGKAKDVRPAIERGIREAKKKLIHVGLGCGSWECRCGGQHSLQTKCYGREGSVKIELRPAPKGTGIVAGETARKVLQLAGVKDAWSSTLGSTGTVFNFANATLHALQQTRSRRMGRSE